MTSPIPMDELFLREMGPLQLAHVGDAVYELLVRTYLAGKGPEKLSEQHRRTVSFVSAPAQAEAVGRLMPFLTEEEIHVFRRGRNARVHGCPVGCTPAQYHAATGLEALFGWLWLRGDAPRAEALFAAIIQN